MTSKPIIIEPGGNGASKVVQPQRDPFRELQNAIMGIPTARTKAESMQRVRYCVQILAGMQKALVNLTVDKDRLINLLRAESDGQLYLIQLEPKPGSSGFKFVDADDKPVPIADASQGFILVKPQHVFPISAVFVFPDGRTEREEMKDFTPHETEAETEPAES